MTHTHIDTDELAELYINAAAAAVADGRVTLDERADWIERMVVDPDAAVKELRALPTGVQRGAELYAAHHGKPVAARVDMSGEPSVQRGQDLYAQLHPTGSRFAASDKHEPPSTSSSVLGLVSPSADNPDIRWPADRIPVNRTAPTVVNATGVFAENGWSAQA